MIATCRNCKTAYEPPCHEKQKRDYMCSLCRSEYNRAYRERRKAQGLSVSGTPSSREYQKAYQYEYRKRPEVRERKKEEAKTRRTDPIERQKQRVRRKTRSAIERGILSRQPCEKCGAFEVDAHHDDYSKPLDVRWLCRTHHAGVHAKAKGGDA